MSKQLDRNEIDKRLQRMSDADLIQWAFDASSAIGLGEITELNGYGLAALIKELAGRFSIRQISVAPEVKALRDLTLLVKESDYVRLRISPPFERANELLEGLDG